MLEFELLCVKLIQMLPSLSTAVIMLILGDIAFDLIDHSRFIGRQCIFLKSVIPSHVSSMLMMFLFFQSISRNEIAHRCLSTMHLSELACIAI
jgi:hypothetical protein